MRRGQVHRRFVQSIFNEGIDAAYGAARAVRFESNDQWNWGPIKRQVCAKSVVGTE